MNVDGYYNSLLSFIDTAVDEGFIAPSARHIIVSAPTADELMCKLEVVHYSMQHDSSCFMWDKVIGPTNCIYVQFLMAQEYVPEHYGEASKLSWEMEQ